tara:strand:- start:1704 stop:2204 length:501 start_codon:yes stop_codon:yes gene_type:complete
MDKFKLLVELFDAIDIKIKTREDLLNIILRQDTLKDRNLIEELYRKAPNLKSFYNSSKLTCLHKNSLDKQKFPAVNMYRQLLKCNNLKMEPYVVSKGYNKYSGKKIVERFYRIKELSEKDSENDNLDEIKESLKDDIKENIVTSDLEKLETKQDIFENIISGTTMD